LPNGGHQLLWYFGDSSHGDGLTEGLDDLQRRVWLEIVLLGHQRLPGSGPSTPEVTPLLPALCLFVAHSSLHGS
jgi:hypothetical protein